MKQIRIESENLIIFSVFKDIFIFFYSYITVLNIFLTFFLFTTILFRTFWYYIYILQIFSNYENTKGIDIWFYTFLHSQFFFPTRKLYFGVILYIKICFVQSFLNFLQIFFLVSKFHEHLCDWIVLFVLIFFPLIFLRISDR